MNHLASYHFASQHSASNHLAGSGVAAPATGGGSQAAVMVMTLGESDEREPVDDVLDDWMAQAMGHESDRGL